MTRTAFIYRQARLILCPLLQAALGGDRRVPSMYFDTAQWATTPLLETPTRMTGTEEGWVQLAQEWRSDGHE